MNTRHTFDKELEVLQSELVKMGSMVERSIENAITALVNQDADLARKIYSDDDIIDEFEKVIEHHCINLIARQQPMAKDLRTISSTLKVITDLERIADHASDIAEVTLQMVDQKYFKKLIDIPRMAELAQNMVSRSLDAYMKNDLVLAHKVYDDDEAIDVIHCKIVMDLKKVMKEEPDSVDQAVNFMAIAKYFERMGDHASNICEWVNYNVNGVHESFSHKLFEDREIVDRYKEFKEEDLCDNF